MRVMLCVYVMLDMYVVCVCMYGWINGYMAKCMHVCMYDDGDGCMCYDHVDDDDVCMILYVCIFDDADGVWCLLFGDDGR